MSGSGFDVAVVTSLYPSPPRPREGIFAERRWLGMAARGHTVRVVVPLPRSPLGNLLGGLGPRHWAEIAAMPEREERGGLSVHRPRYLHLPGRARGNAQRFARTALKSALGERKPEVVFCDYAWPAAAVAPALREAGLPCVIHGRGSDVLEVAAEAGLAEPLADCLRAAGRWCAVSAELVEVMDRLGQDPGRGVLVPNGVDAGVFHPMDRVQCRDALGLAPEGLLVLVVGHLIPRKDPLLALEVFRRGAPEDARLVFVGRGPLEDELAGAIRDGGSSERVKIMGECAPKELAQFYGAADVVLLTSRREGRPNVVLEALACGRPVLATAVGGTRELLEGERDRMLQDSRDPARLGQALSRLLDDAPEPAELVAHVAALTWDASLEMLESVLAAAVGEEHP